MARLNAFLLYHHPDVHRTNLDMLHLPGSEDILLVDFNPFSPVTDSLMFEWHELVSKGSTVTASSAGGSSTSAAARDTTTHAHTTTAVPRKFDATSTAAQIQAMSTGSNPGDQDLDGADELSLPTSDSEVAPGGNAVGTNTTPALPPTLTDRLNQKLLTSFLDRVNDPDSTLSVFDNATRNADKSAEEDDGAWLAYCCD